ncbi:MAG: SPOR domain-containing protein [Pseudomonadales bacterium]|nr:SPOR domain-containing protein [Pseudomonadales bacterium]
MKTKAISLLGGGALLLCAAILPAQGASSAHYWVLGSFSKVSSAQKEERRLEDLLSKDIDIVSFSSADNTYYRLIVEKSGLDQAAMSMLEEKQITPWLVPLSEDQIRFAREIVKEVAASVETRYSLVLAGFNRRDKAEQLVADLVRKSMDRVSVAETQQGGEPYYRVVFGPFDAETRSARSKAEVYGFTDTFWISTDAEMPAAAVAPTPAINSAWEPEPVDDPEDFMSTANTDEADAAPASNLATTESGLIREKQMISGFNRDQFIRFCTTLATSQQRERYCQDLTRAPRSN